MDKIFIGGMKVFEAPNLKGSILDLGKDGGGQRKEVLLDFFFP